MYAAARGIAHNLILMNLHRPSMGIRRIADTWSTSHGSRAGGSAAEA
jgi:hypothetical protein